LFCLWTPSSARELCFPYYLRRAAYAKYTGALVLQRPGPMDYSSAPSTMTAREDPSTAGGRACRLVGWFQAYGSPSRSHISTTAWNHPITSTHFTVCGSSHWVDDTLLLIRAIIMPFGHSEAFAAKHCWILYRAIIMPLFSFLHAPRRAREILRIRQLCHRRTMPPRTSSSPTSFVAACCVAGVGDRLSTMVVRRLHQPGLFYIDFNFILRLDLALYYYAAASSWVHNDQQMAPCAWATIV
jgi:hypothetical protein